MSRSRSSTTRIWACIAFPPIGQVNLFNLSFPFRPFGGLATSRGGPCQPWTFWHSGTLRRPLAVFLGGIHVYRSVRVRRRFGWSIKPFSTAQVLAPSLRQHMAWKTPRKTNVCLFLHLWLQLHLPFANFSGTGASSSGTGFRRLASVGGILGPTLRLCPCFMSELGLSKVSIWLNSMSSTAVNQHWLTSKCSGQFHTRRQEFFIPKKAIFEFVSPIVNVQSHLTI